MFLKMLIIHVLLDYIIEIYDSIHVHYVKHGKSSQENGIFFFWNVVIFWKNCHVSDKIYHVEKCTMFLRRFIMFYVQHMLKNLQRRFIVLRVASHESNHRFQ